MVSIIACSAFSKAPPSPGSQTDRTVALCAGVRRLRLLSVTGFPSASVLGWQSSRLPTDYMGMAEVSRRARGARPCPRHERAFSGQDGDV